MKLKLLDEAAAKKFATKIDARRTTPAGTSSLEISIHGIDSQRDESRGMLLKKISPNAWCSLIRRSDVTPSREVRAVDWRKEDRSSLFVHGERD
nr:hypothetical protein Iba_scaffold1199529CG0010 [Ipomoea batatas]